MSWLRNVRFAAAYLESVAPADRKWLLAQLPAEMARRVEVERASLPSALRAFDVRDLMQDAATSSTTISTPAVEPKEFESFLDDAAHTRLVKAEGVAVMKALSGMPDWFCLALIGMHDWPWTDFLLAAKPYLRKPLFDRRPPTVTMATRRAVVRSVSAALDHVES